MRIISGYSRGIRLVAPEGPDIRPTEDKVKESLFSTLGDLSGLAVLDLFSGSGALGLEALSRGAARVVMCERAPRHVAAIRTNLAAVLKAFAPHQPGQTQILEADVRKCAGILAGEHFDIILADPPYHTAEGEYGAHELLSDNAMAALANEDTILALEHASAIRDLPFAPASPWRLLKSRAFGIRAVSYCRFSTP